MGKLKYNIDNFLENGIKFIFMQENQELSDELILLYDFKEYFSEEILEKKLYDSASLLKKQIEFYELNNLNDFIFLEYIYKAALAFSEFAKLGLFTKFSNSLNIFLIQKTNEMVRVAYNSKDDNYLLKLFPLVGEIIYFLADFNYNINELINYLSYNFEYKDYKNFMLPRFHICNLNKEFKKNNPDGIIPIGMAHGYLKPLISMAKLVSLGYENQSLSTYVNNIFSIYEIYYSRLDDIIFWPNFITYNEYITRKFGMEDKQFRASWCSGNLSTAYGLYKVCEYMNLPQKKFFYENEIIAILKQDDTKFNLKTSILCHGYSSILTYLYVFLKKQQNFEDDLVLKNKDFFSNKLIELFEGKSFETVFKENFFSSSSILYGISGTLLTIKNSTYKNKMLYEKLILLD